jgi:hypothetical protein
VCLIVYRYYWLRGAVDEGFTHDDLMNLYRAVTNSWGELVRDLFTIWRPSALVRPMGELAYRVLWLRFGFSPWPYHFVCLTLGAANMLLAFAIGRAVLKNVWLALAIGWFLAYHGEMSGAYSNVGTIFDLLASFFYLLALWIAVGNTKKEIRLALLVAVTLAALDSKEMAVSLPLAIAGVLKGRTSQRTRIWNFITVAMLALMAGVYVLGRVLGHGGVAEVPSYQPSISIAQFAGNFATLLSTLCYDLIHWTPAAALAFFLVPLAVFLIARLWFASFAWMMFVVSFLPLAFIPTRGLDAASLPLFWMLLGLAAGLKPLTERNHAVRVFAPVLLMIAITVWHARIGAAPYPQFGAESNDIRIAYDGISKSLAALPPDAHVAIIEDEFNPTFEWATLFMARLATGHDWTLYRPADLKQLSPSERIDAALKVTPDGVLTCTEPNGAPPNLEQIRSGEFTCTAR